MKRNLFFKLCNLYKGRTSALWCRVTATGSSHLFAKHLFFFVQILNAAKLLTVTGNGKKTDNIASMSST